MSISIQYLARLGRERTIPSLFERAWMQMYGGGSNPVAMAMKIVENKRRKNNWNSLIFGMLALLAVAGFPVVGFVKYDGHATGELIGYITQFILLLMVFLGMSVAVEEKGEEVGDATKSHIASFCECLDLMSGWTGNYRSFDPALYRGSDEEIKKVGTDILVEAAINVLRIQENEKSAESSDIKERLQVSAGNAMAEFTKRYNTLQRIGLASGGYDKYFEAARRIIDSATPSPIR